MKEIPNGIIENKYKYELFFFYFIQILVLLFEVIIITLELSGVSEKKVSCFLLFMNWLVVLTILCLFVCKHPLFKLGLLLLESRI